MLQLCSSRALPLLCALLCCEGKMGEEGGKGCRFWFGLRDLHYCCSKDLGMGSGEEGCVPSPPRVPEECQTFKGCFLRLRKMFAQIKGETYLIPSDGWVAEQLVSQKVSLLQVV